MTVVQTVEARLLRESVSTALSAGARFSGAWATTGGGWRIAHTHGGQTTVLVCSADTWSFDSIVDLVPAADWDEREAHDLLGLNFDGHEPLRALVDHPRQLADWTIPVDGDGVHQVAVGPIHAGVIESGHFRFHCVGDQIIALDPRLFYKHRGLELAAEGRTPEAALAYMGRACAACHVANSVAYAHAVEETRGLWPSPALARQRTVLLEVERTYNHLNDIGAVCAGVGFAGGAMAFSVFKDRTQELCREAFGHRFLFGTVAIGQGLATLDQNGADALREGLREIRVDASRAWRDLEFAASFQARLDGVGVLDRDAALRLGVVGPAARACGVNLDARTGDARLSTAELTPATLSHPEGDVAARLKLRAAELPVSWDVLDELLATELGGGDAAAAGPGSEIGVGRVESPRGETVCMVELDARHLARVHLRTASYANWPAVAAAAAGNLMPDFPLINKSFELCYACADR